MNFFKLNFYKKYYYVNKKYNSILTKTVFLDKIIILVITTKFES